MKTPEWCVSGKLAVPRTRHHVLERRRAVDRLLGVLSRKLAIICAPAGYGKTTLLVQLYEALGAREAAPAWLTLDSDDRLEKRFLAYAVIALAGISRPFGRLVAAAGEHFQGIPEATVRAAILHACGRTSQHLVLLLDDFDAVADSGIGALVESMVERMPDNLHLVLAARGQPRLPIATLAARDEVIQIGVDDLRFDADEATALFASEAPRKLAATEIETLTEKTEGWPIALQLARALLATPSHERPDINALTGRATFVSDYLMHQVFERLPERERQVLLSTAPLERFNGDVANVLCGRDDGWQILAELERRGLFVVPLDPEHEWYRYHKMFREFLCERLRREPGMASRELRITAAGWFAAQGHIDDAIGLYRQVDEHGRAADLLDSRRIWRLLGSADESRLYRALQSLPQATLLERPRLHLARIMLDAGAGSSIDLAAALAEFRQRHGGRLSAEPRLQREITVFETMFRLGALDEPADRAALITIERGAAGEHGYDEVELAVLQYSLCAASLDYCAFEECERFAGEAMRHFFNADLPYAARWLDVFVAQSNVARGRLEQALQVLDRARAAMAETFGPRTDLGAMVDVVTAELMFERNALGEAQALLDASFARATAAGGWMNVYASGFRTAASLARIRQGPEAALEVLDGARAMACRKGSARLERFAALHAIRELCLAGRTQEAAKRAREIPLATNVREQVASRLGWQLWDPEGALVARLLLAAGEPDRAIAILRSLRGELTALGCARQRIGITSLLALALRARGERQAAVRETGEALMLAAVGGHERVFLDEGAVLLDLIAAASKETQALSAPARHLAQRLLAGADATRASEPEPAEEASGDLSQREIDVLGMIERGLSSKEMARELHISENTVKFYRKSIYRKLRISARSEAVAAARRLMPGRQGPSR